MPSVGDVFADVRDEGRTLRVSYHEDRGVVVLSLWSGAICRGSFRMNTADVGRLLAVLAQMTPEASNPTDSSGQGVDPAAAPAANRTDRAEAGPDRPDSTFGAGPVLRTA
jgi:hypothetical protein